MDHFTDATQYHNFSYSSFLKWTMNLSCWTWRLRSWESNQNMGTQTCQFYRHVCTGPTLGSWHTYKEQRLKRASGSSLLRLPRLLQTIKGPWLRKPNNRACSQSRSLIGVSTGDPSSSCELIMLRNSCHGRRVCMGIFTITLRTWDLLPRSKLPLVHGNPVY